MNRYFILSLLLLSLLLFIYSRIPVYSALEYDPPSVFNMGSGGISAYIYRKFLTNRVYIVYDLDLDRFYPNNSVLLIIGPDRPLDNIDGVLRFVYKGGIAIVADESDNVSKLLNSIGVSMEDVVYSIDVATCIFNESSIDLVLFDVYRPLKALPQNGRVLCRYGSKILAASIPYGDGKIIVIGDSSIVINEVIDSPFLVNNTLFMDNIIGGRNIVVYEGSRIYRAVESIVFIDSFNTIAYIVSFLAELVCSGSPLYLAIKLFTISTLISLFTISRFGLPKPVEAYPKAVFNQIRDDIRKRISEGLKGWGIVEE